MRRFELVEGTSSKFWEAATEGSEMTVRFGRIGTNGQTQTKTFADEDKAASELEKLIKEKLKKGYSEIAAAPALAGTKGKAVATSGKAAATPAKAAAAPAKALAAPAKAAAGPAKAGSAKASGAAAPAGPAASDGYLPGPKGYLLGLDGKKLVARNAAGKALASVPKDLRESDVGEQLIALADWIANHAAEAVAWAETWMLRSLPVPAKVIEAVWPDDAYRAALENLVVFAAGKGGALDPKKGGLLKGADPARGVGVVDRDGETAWLRVDEILVPHPIAIAALDDWRALAQELSATQGAQQLFREVFTRPSDVAADASAIKRFAGGKFEQLNHVIGAAKSLGYRVSGGSAISRVLEKGRTLEARFWIGDGDPTEDAITGELLWVDHEQRGVAVGNVTPIAFSEGMRMASAIFAKRVLEENKEEA